MQGRPYHGHFGLLGPLWNEIRGSHTKSLMNHAKIQQMPYKNAARGVKKEVKCKVSLLERAKDAVTFATWKRNRIIGNPGRSIEKSRPRREKRSKM